MKKISRKKAKRSKIRIIDLLLFVIYVLLTGLLIFNIFKLSNIETLIRIIVIIVLILSIVGILFLQKKKRLLAKIIIIILSLVYGFLNYTFYRVYSSLDNITSNVDTKGICLVTHSDTIKDIADITDSDIAILGKNMDEQFYSMALEVLDSETLTNELVEYDGYFEIIDALLNKKIEYAFLPENYNDIYNSGNGEEDKKELKFNVLYTKQKVIKNEETEVPTKMLDEPFTMLLMGTDVILDSYNADTLMVLSVNPKTMKVTMLSIPRDTYTTIACTGGKHKINASGWYGDSCVVKTVSKYLNIDIDYYAKINFLGIVDLVDDLGGVEVDVPYAFCEQNSKRQFGNNMVFVDSGLQTLNGEQALALSRNRHYWVGMCPSKYTSDGNRSDLTRGQNQQLVIKAILSKLMTVRDLNKFYEILDTIGENMTTNMSKETILSFYNVGKSIVKKFNASNADEVMNIERLSVKSNFATVYVSGMQLSMIVNYKESVEYVSNQMKKNLGIIKNEAIKTFSFDINEEYNPDEVKYNKLTYDLKLLPNFVGKSLDEAISYCNKNGLKCESSNNQSTGIIASQSISHNTDISTMRNKTLIFELEAIVDKNTDKDKPNKNEEDNINNSDTPSLEDDKNNSDNKTEDDKENSSENNEDNKNDNTSGDDSTNKDEPVITPPPEDEGNTDNEGTGVDEKED